MGKSVRALHTEDESCFLCAGFQSLRVARMLMALIPRAALMGLLLALLVTFSNIFPQSVENVRCRCTCAKLQRQ